jgi:hypothetical protein
MEIGRGGKGNAERRDETVEKEGKLRKRREEGGKGRGRP